MWKTTISNEKHTPIGKTQYFYEESFTPKPQSEAHNNTLSDIYSIHIYKYIFIDKWYGTQMIQNTLLEIWPTSWKWRVGSKFPSLCIETLINVSLFTKLLELFMPLRLTQCLYDFPCCCIFSHFHCGGEIPIIFLTNHIKHSGFVLASFTWEKWCNPYNFPFPTSVKIPWKIFHFMPLVTW